MRVGNFVLFLFSLLFCSRVQLFLIILEYEVLFFPNKLDRISFSMIQVLTEWIRIEKRANRAYFDSKLGVTSRIDLVEKFWSSPDA